MKLLGDFFPVRARRHDKTPELQRAGGRWAGGGRVEHGSPERAFMAVGSGSEPKSGPVLVNCVPG